MRVVARSVTWIAVRGARRRSDHGASAVATNAHARVRHTQAQRRRHLPTRAPLAALLPAPLAPPSTPPPAPSPSPLSHHHCYSSSAWTLSSHAQWSRSLWLVCCTQTGPLRCYSVTPSTREWYIVSAAAVARLDRVRTPEAPDQIPAPILCHVSPQGLRRPGRGVRSYAHRRRPHRCRPA